MRFRIGLLLMFVIFAWSFEHFVGHYDGALPIDLLCFLLPPLIVGRIVSRRAHLAGTRWRKTGVMMLTLGASWIALSACDTLFFSRPLALKGRQPAPESAPSVAIAISGGGFRAAIFHAGVLSVLEERHVPIRVMSSVSGGSIFAAYYAAGGDPEGFRQALIEHRFNLKRNLCHIQNAIRLVATSVLPIGDFTRTDVQAAMLDSLFLHGVRHRDFGASPELMLCTTDLSGSEMIGVNRYGAVEQPIATAVERSCFANPAAVGMGKTVPPAFTMSADCGLPADETTSSLVAASGAFPGAFRPKRVVTSIETSVISHTTLQYLLADGGVGDNLGLVLLDDAHQLAHASRLERQKQISPAIVPNAMAQWPIAAWETDLVIASDASAISPRSTPRTSLAEVGRAIDVIYASTGGDQMTGRVSGDASIPPTILITPRSLLVSISPSDLRSHNTQAIHLYFGTEMVLRIAPPTPPNGIESPPPQISMMAFPPELVRALVANMREGDRAAALRALSVLNRNGIYRKGRWGQPTFAPGTAERVLYDACRTELLRRMSVFITTSTLEDQIPGLDAESIFLLGRYLAMMNMPYIDYELAVKRNGSPRTYGPCGPTSGS
ncbi:MAG TPA: patatin-like phospholipase family protein [Thermoanaerobaculia bacterium]